MARLIAAGANVRACDSRGTSVLQRSISSTADIEVVKALLTAGADPNLVRDGGSSALARARHHPRADLVQVLIDAGARE